MVALSLPPEGPQALYMSARYLRGLLDHVRARGGALEPVLLAMGLEEAQLLAPDTLLPHQRQDAIFEAAARVTGDPNVGLHAGEAVPVTLFGVVGQLALTCRTGAELLDLQVRYQSLIGNGLRSSCQRDATRVALYFEVARDVTRHAIEYTLAAQITLARFLAGPAFTPTRVTFCHPRPAQHDAQQRVFGCSIQYDAPALRIELPRAVDTLPLVGAEPGVREALEAAARQRLDALRVRLEADDSDRQRCEQYIAARLSAGAPSIEQTAEALGSSVRTLQRRLEAQGVSYREVVDTARRRVAERLVHDASLSLLDVALLVGFAEQSAFNRAFRRWFGATPSEVRART